VGGLFAKCAPTVYVVMEVLYSFCAFMHQQPLVHQILYLYCVTLTEHFGTSVCQDEFNGANGRHMSCPLDGLSLALIFFLILVLL
jgi:hypothetical protein